jgi:hypothetical protein
MVVAVVAAAAAAAAADRDMAPAADMAGVALALASSRRRAGRVRGIAGN